MCVLQTVTQELNGVQFLMVTKFTDYGSLFFFVLLSAIELNKKYSKAFMKRARAYEELGKKEECLQGN